MISSNLECLGVYAIAAPQGNEGGRSTRSEVIRPWKPADSATRLLCPSYAQAHATIIRWRFQNTGAHGTLPFRTVGTAKGHPNPKERNLHFQTQSMLSHHLECPLRFKTSSRHVSPVGATQKSSIHQILYAQLLHRVLSWVSKSGSNCTECQHWG